MNGTPSRYPAGDLRVSDADRDAMLIELSEHFQAGRLTSAELDERTGKALAARTERDLDELTTDLPPLPDRAGAGRATARSGRSGSYLYAAVCLAAIGFIASAAFFPGHVRGGFFPWWLIPVGFLVFRRLTRGARRADGRQDTRP